MNKRVLPVFAVWIPVVLAPEFLFGTPSSTRSFISLIMTVGVFFLLRYLVASQRSQDFVRKIDSKSAVIAFGVMIAHFLLFTAAVVLRHMYFSSEHGDDTAYYNQIFWNTLHGDFFRGSVTQERYSDPPVDSEFAVHNSPVLFLILPLYSIFPSFYTLLIIKNLCLSAGAMPLYFLAKDKVNGVAGLIIMVGYYSSANIFFQALNGFYPLQLIALFLPLAFLYFFREQFWLFVFWLAMALSVREEIALTTALFGILAVFLKRDWRWAITAIVMSMVWWYVSTELVMVRSRIAMEELDAFYEMFGGGHNGALARVLEDPGKFVSLFFNFQAAAYVYQLIKPTAGFLLFSISCLFVLPTLVVNCLIGAFMITMVNISYHYSIVAGICVFVATIMGIARLTKHREMPQLNTEIFKTGLSFLLIPIIILGILDNVRSGANHSESPFVDYLPTPDQGMLEQIIGMLPAEASVAAPNILMPHLSYRRKLYSADRLWRYNSPRLDYIVLNTRVERLSASDRNKSKYEAVISRTRGNSHYRLIFNEKGFEVYRGLTVAVPSDRLKSTIH